MRPADGVLVAFAAWVLGATVLLFWAGVEVLVVLALIGLLVIRQLAGPALLEPTRARVDVVIAGLLVAFAVVVVRRVAEILGGA